MNAYCPPAPCPPSGPQPPFPPYPPFPANPKPGDRFGSWIWNGSQWVVSTASGTTINTQVFKATGTYQPSPGLTSIVVECVGGGGGGGGSASNFVPAAGGWSSGGGGGGAGGYSRVTLPAALVMGGAAVTIGAGGLGGAGGANVASAAGTNGGDTSFAGYCIAHGGAGGGAGDVGVAGGGLGGGGGAGGAKGIGDVATTGGTGTAGRDLYIPSGSTAIANTWGGNGGVSFFGGSGAGAPSYPGGPNQGPPGNGMDGGGGGGACTGVATDASAVGGNGGIGICVVTEYITLPAPNSGSGTSQPGTSCCPCCGQPVSSCSCTQTGNAPVPIDAMASGGMAWGRRW